MQVIVDHRGIENALRRLKRKLKDDNFYNEVKKHLYYTKPSTLKKEAKNKGLRRTKFKNGTQEEN